jgi:hypothetical protein
MFTSWIDVDQPWEPLDEDGEEDPFEDTVSFLVAKGHGCPTLR